MKFGEIQKEVTQLESGRKGNPDIIYFKDDTEDYIRLVPMDNIPPELNLGDQFVKAWVHYKSGGVVPETTFSPKTFNQEDPVEEFVALARREWMGPQKFKQYMNMLPSEVYITTAVVRGKESAGTKLLTLSKGQFKQLTEDVSKSFKMLEMNINDFDLADVKEGFDILVTCKGKDPNKKNSYRSYSYGVNATKPKPLAEDEQTLANLLDNQPDWKETYEKISVDKLEGYLESALEMGDDDDFEVEGNESNETENQTEQTYDRKVSDDEVIENASKDLQNMMANSDEPVTEDAGDEDDDLPF